MVFFSWAVVSFFIELFCVVTLQYQILVRIAIAYFIIEKKKAAPQPWQAIAAADFVQLEIIVPSPESFTLLQTQLHTADAISAKLYAIALASAPSGVSQNSQPLRPVTKDFIFCSLRLLLRLQRPSSK